MTAREEILARIRTALGPAPSAPPIPREYRRTAPDEGLVELFTDRLLDYRASVVPATADSLEAIIDAAVTGRTLVPADLPWVVTGCAVGIAETGTIVLDGSPDQGRRAISLVPDRHVCVVRADQIVATVPELLTRLDPRRPLTFISGPSATSDIELTRVEGVHGPRTLIVILVADR